MQTFSKIHILFNTHNMSRKVTKKCFMRKNDSKRNSHLLNEKEMSKTLSRKIHPSLIFFKNLNLKV